MMSPRPRRVEPFDQCLEGHVLMPVGGQTALAHPVQQLAEGGIPGEVDP